MNIYTIEVNEKQARVLIDALDVFSRILSGQVGMLEETLRFSSSQFPASSNNFDLRIEHLSKVQDLCVEINKILGFGGHGSLGISHKDLDPKSKIAYDILQVIRHRMAWDNLEAEGKSKPDFFSTHYDEPFSYSSEPFPRITKSQEINEPH